MPRIISPVLSDLAAVGSLRPQVFGPDVVLQFDRQIGVAAVGMVLTHPVVLIATEPDYLRFFDPRVC